MDPALLAMLTDTVPLAPWTGQDGYGAPTYGPAVPTPARVEYRQRRIVNAQGQERMSLCTVFFNGNVTVDLRDKLILPDTTSPAIQLVYPVRDEVGAVDHWEVML